MTVGAPAHRPAPTASPAVVLARLEAVAIEVTARVGAGLSALQALTAVLTPARVLVVGSGGRRRLALLGDRGALRTLIALDHTAPERTASWHRGGRIGPPELHVFRATLGAGTATADNVTRFPALVEALTENGFDLICLRADESGPRLYLDLAQLVPLLNPGGLLLCEGVERVPEAEPALARLVAEGVALAVTARRHAAAPSVVLVQARAPIRTHETTTTLRQRLLFEDPSLADLVETGDGAAVCAHLRHWLARRLVWSTADLALPLAALPPPLAVEDVIERCRLGEGGVQAAGAAVTLTMLYRAFGFPASVYQYGQLDTYWHMVTLVRLADGRTLVQDALFDREARLDGTAAAWPALVTAARRGEVARVRFAPDTVTTRLHLYSPAGLERAAAEGWLDAEETAAVGRALATLGRIGGAPRAGLAQTLSTDPARWEALPRQRHALGAVADRTGIGSALGLLGLPCGAVPLSGDAALDDEIRAVLGAPAAPAAPAARGS